MFIPAGDELEEQVRGVWFKRQIANFVDDDQPVSAKPGQFFVEGSGLVRLLESADPAGGSGKQHAVALMAGKNS